MVRPWKMISWRNAGLKSGNVFPRYKRRPALAMERATRAAHLRTRYKLPFADSFGLELAYNISGHILVTADFDVKPAAQDIAIEFLPLKPKA